MLSTDTLAATPGCVLDTVSIPTQPHGSTSQLNLLRLSLASASSEPDIERARVCNPIASGDGSPVCEGMTASSCPRQNEEPAVSTSLPWQHRILAFFTMYGELSVACTPEEFAFVRTRLQWEWTFNGGFLIALAAVNVAMFAITPDSIFKVDSYAHTAVAISSAACGLGIACDVWFLIRYNWVDLRTFICRSRDVYGSYAFFSLSSRIPTFCMLISSFSLMSFLCLIAFEAWPVGVVGIGMLVVLVMILQFIVYGATSVVNIVKSFVRGR